jgi:hypothetical protein
MARRGQQKYRQAGRGELNREAAGGAAGALSAQHAWIPTRRCGGRAAAGPMPIGRGGDKEKDTQHLTEGGFPRHGQPPPPAPGPAAGRDRRSEVAAQVARAEVAAHVASVVSARTAGRASLATDGFRSKVSREFMGRNEDGARKAEPSPCQLGHGEVSKPVGGPPP